MRVLFLFFVSFSGAHASHFSVKVGDSKVMINQQSNGCGKAFVHLHQNETTALKAARLVMHERGGSVLTLIHAGGGRNVVFHIGKARYECDPNRIFTDNGIRKTLLQFGDYTPQAHKEIKRLADKIKTLLPQGKIIAVHNNETYSLHNYMPGHDLAKDARSLNMHKQNFFRNFYLVTKQRDYVRLKQLRFNSIWQASQASDDGSLSVYLGKKNYVNVEAGYDQLAAQIRMLRYA